MKVGKYVTPHLALYGLADFKKSNFLSEHWSGDPESRSVQELTTYFAGIGGKVFLANFDSPYFEVTFGYGNTQLETANLGYGSVDDIDYDDTSYTVGIGFGLELTDTFVLSANVSRIEIDIAVDNPVYNPQDFYDGTEQIFIGTVQLEIRM